MLDQKRYFIYLLMMPLLTCCGLGGTCEEEEEEEEEVVQTVVSTPSTGSATSLPSSSLSSSYGMGSSTSQGVQPAALAVDEVSELPTCDGSVTNYIYFVINDQSFQMCDGEEYIAIDIRGATGSKGEQGEKGAQGAQGEIGITGVAGEDASSVKLFTGDDVAMGTIFNIGDEPYTVLSNNGIAMFNMATGQYIQSVAFDNNQSKGKLYPNINATCRFQSADCSGTCYLANNDANITPLKNAAFYTGSAWFIATGNETDVGSQVYDSYFYNGICIVNNATIDHGYAITTDYELPEGLTIPLSTPLYAGVGQ